MAATGTPTPNIGLRRPQGTDPASVDDINYNSNLIDTKLGPVGNSSVQEQIDSLNSNLANIGKSSQFNVTAGDHVTITSQRNCSLNGNTTQKLVSIMFTTSEDINNGILFTGFFAVGAMNSIIPIYLVSSAGTEVYSMRISGNGQANANGLLPAGSYCANGVYI